MGLGGFSCCSCNNIKKSTYFEDEPQQKRDITNSEENQKIKDQSNLNNINVKASMIFNQQLIQPNIIKISVQEQDNDSFDNHYSQLL